jgi:hypothetical protein
MAAHPYAPFVQWATFSYFRGSWHDLDISKPTMAWIRSFGVTAARIDRFLKLGHSGGHTLPNSLVLDIIELENSPLSRALTTTVSKACSVRGLQWPMFTVESPRHQNSK